jgi:glycerophosphoryl diester phosphodiesterase
MRGTSHAPYLEGNTLDSIQTAAREGIGYIEVDLVLTRDGALVTAHQSYVKGCGTINTMLLNQVLGCRLPGGLRLATLEAVLALPFKGVFLDLKDTRDADETRSQRAVARAAAAVVERHRTREAVLMLYETPAASVQPIVRNHLRAGVKGYPKSIEQTREMAARAAQLGFEMLSVNTDYVTPELLADSARQGVWHLPWSTDPASAAHWRALAEAGAGGLIVLHYDLARKDIAPHWVDARTLNPSVSSIQ